jgi:hypothetical protein
MLVTNQFKSVKPQALCTELIAVVGNRFFVSKSLFDDVRAQVEIMSQYLICGEVYNPADIVGHDYWQRLSREDRNQCILILKDIAKEEPDVLLEVALKKNQGLGFVFTKLDEEFDCNFVNASSCEKEGGSHE